MSLLTRFLSILAPNPAPDLREPLPCLPCTAPAPQYMYPNRILPASGRGSGRTTAMLVEAVNCAYQPEALVAVIGKDARHASQMLRDTMQLFPSLVRNGDALVTPSNGYILFCGSVRDLRAYRTEDHAPNPFRVFVDHCAE